MKRQRHNKKRIIIGITGSLGSGKTSVARIFGSLGAQLIDADKIAHRIILSKTKTYKSIIKIFGEGILKKNREINRKKLAQIVFNNKNLLKVLNKLLHQRIIKIIEDRIKNSESKVIVLDAPLLIETGLEKIVDKLVVVKISQKNQLQRLQNKTSLGEKDILKRIRCQIPLGKKILLANFVIDNNNSIGKTKKQVHKIWREIKTCGL